MAKEYFSHDCDAQFDDKCVRLLQVLGWKGYGVYWGLVERMSKRDDCSLEYNPAGLAWQLHVQEKFLVRVLTEFNLFTISEDGTRFWSESARRRRAMRYKKYDPTQPKRKPGRPRKYPRPEDAAPQEPEPQPKPEPIVAPTVERNLPEVRKIEPETKVVETAPQKPQNDVHEQPLSIYQPKRNDDAREQTSASCHPSNDSYCNQPQYEDDVETVEETFPSSEIIELWNIAFHGTSQVYRGLGLDSISFQRAKDAFEAGYDLSDMRKAFEIARDDRFTWLLKDVLKPDNIQRLLAKGEKEQYAVNTFAGANFGNSPQVENEDPNDWRNDAFWAPYTRLEPETRSVACCPQ